VTWLEWVRRGSPELTTPERPAQDALGARSRPAEVRTQSPDDVSIRDDRSQVAPAAALVPVPRAASTYSDIPDDARPLADAFPQVAMNDNSVPANDGPPAQLDDEPGYYAQVRDAARVRQASPAERYSPGSIAGARYERLYHAPSRHTLFEWRR
jgi:hypothetical protein